MSIWENDGMNGVDSVEVHEDIIQSILSTPSTLQFYHLYRATVIIHYLSNQ